MNTDLSTLTEAAATKADRVATELRAEIASGRLGPGAALRQRDLAQRFGVSPTPVREALQRLEAEGFVTGAAHQSAVVVRQEEVRLYENHLIRASLESLAVRLAIPRLTDRDLADLRARADRFAAAPPGTLEATAANREFHFRIYELANAPVLLRLLQMLWSALSIGPQNYRPHEQSIAQHDELLRHLADRNEAAAAAATEAHVLGTGEAIRAGAQPRLRTDAQP